MREEAGEAGEAGETLDPGVIPAQPHSPHSKVRISATPKDRRFSLHQAEQLAMLVAKKPEKGSIEPENLSQENR